MFLFVSVYLQAFCKSQIVFIDRLQNVEYWCGSLCAEGHSYGFDFQDEKKNLGSDDDDDDSWISDDEPAKSKALSTFTKLKNSLFGTVRLYFWVFTITALQTSNGFFYISPPCLE